MDSTRSIIRHQILTGERKGEMLTPKEISLRKAVLDWEYGCDVDCKHYKPNFFGDYGCEFESCPYKDKEFEAWRKLRAESYMMPDKRKLRKAYSTIKKEMPWFPDEDKKRRDDG